MQKVVVFAPGRINLIGEHIDYNDGLVLPGAINLGIKFDALKRDDQIVHIDNGDVAEQLELDLSQLTQMSGWKRYVSGVFGVLKSRSYVLGGMSITVNSSLPIGAGMSSSSAFILGLTKAAMELYDQPISESELVAIAREVEYKHIGVEGGIMDQYAIAHGCTGALIALDCRDQTSRYVYSDEVDYSFIVIDSGVEHKLSESGYNQRRQECEQIMQALQADSLRELSYDDYDQLKLRLENPVLRKRLKHVLSEQQRVYEAVEALDQGNWHLLPDLISASHESLKDDYEVSCEEIDFIVDYLRKNLQISSRIMGGGFGGSVLAIVPLHKVSNHTFDELTVAYKNRYNLNMRNYQVKLSQGLHVQQKSN